MINPWSKKVREITARKLENREQNREIIAQISALKFIMTPNHLNVAKMEKRH